MKKQEFSEWEHEANAHTPFPMAHKLVHLTQKDLLDIVDQEKRDQETNFDKFYPLSFYQCSLIIH